MSVGYAWDIDRFELRGDSYMYKSIYAIHIYIYGVVNVGYAYREIVFVTQYGVNKRRHAHGVAVDTVISAHHTRSVFGTRFPCWEKIPGEVGGW